MVAFLCRRSAICRSNLAALKAGGERLPRWCEGRGAGSCWQRRWGAATLWAWGGACGRGHGLRQRGMAVAPTGERGSKTGVAREDMTGV